MDFCPFRRRFGCASAMMPDWLSNWNAEGGVNFFNTGPMVAPVHVDLPALGQCSGAALIRSLFDSLSFAVWVAVVLRSALAFVTVWRGALSRWSFACARAWA